MTLPAYYFYIVLFIIGGVSLLSALLLIMHFFMPRIILQRYFKPPHFTLSELNFFTGIPFSLMRTLMFMAVITNPNKGIKRGISEVRALSPNWYRMISSFIVIGFYAMISCIALGLAAYAWWKITG